MGASTVVLPRMLTVIFCVSPWRCRRSVSGLAVNDEGVVGGMAVEVMLSATAKGTVKPPVTAFGEATVKTISDVPKFGLTTDGLLMVKLSVVALTIVPTPRAPPMRSAGATVPSGVAVPSVIDRSSLLASTIVLPTTLTVIFWTSPAPPAKVSGLAVLTK